jgi:MYXO-CTERM domain-containing protein
MFRRSWGAGGAMALLVWLTASSASADELELKHDGFVDQGQATCQQGFAIGDEAAVSFTHDQDYSLLGVEFLFCGATTTEPVTVRIYRETGGAVPGEMIYEADYQITGAMDALSQINLASEGLTFSAGESFRFSLRLQHAGAPGLASDNDGNVVPDTSWIYDTLSSSWSEASDFGVSGDWIMRATIDTVASGTGGAGGMPTTSTATMMSGVGGQGGAGGADDADGGEEESCSCRAVGTPTTGTYGWLGLGALMLLARRRRRA